MYVRRGELALAKRDYDEALRTSPKDEWSLYGRSIAEAGTGAAAASESDRAVLAAENPDFPEEAARYGIVP